MPEFKHSNLLVHETSPYLLQHAHNPVDWHPWNENTLEKARSLNKLLLISIGYSACHWCHVMEEESFTDEDVARIMNENFICIKVDREERPDIDQVYMEAVQIITGSGGWPLNCFALPDGKPFFGGTYFRKEQWLNLLDNIILLREARNEDLKQQAKSISEGITKNNLLVIPENENNFSREDLETIGSIISGSFDRENGGSPGAPKFPMPGNLQFLLRYFESNNDQSILDHVFLSLDKMACGGIYDQIGGGFSRYSTDSYWKVPHFEKMLYDNAQLISVYSDAYRIKRNPLYKDVIEESLAFVEKELKHPFGGFYSALDADSEGEEGKYYTWTSNEIKEVLGKDHKLFMDYYQVGSGGLWENDKNILIRTSTISEFSKKINLDEKIVSSLLKNSRKKLLKARNKRIKPGVDDKILTSWNALMIQAYIDAYKALNKPAYLESAFEAANFISEHLLKEDGGLYHRWKDGTAGINGFLDDYSFSILAFVELYQLTFDEIWLNLSESLVQYVKSRFANNDNSLLFFTSSDDPELIARKIEIYDNVIPSSNSAFAISLFKLGHLLDNPKYIDDAKKMLQLVHDNILKHPGAFLNWGILLMNFTKEFYTVVMTGENIELFRKGFFRKYQPRLVLMGAHKTSELNNFRNRFVKNKSMIYVCSGNECKTAVESVEEALRQI